MLRPVTHKRIEKNTPTRNRPSVTGLESRNDVPIAERPVGWGRVTVVPGRNKGLLPPTTAPRLASQGRLGRAATVRKGQDSRPQAPEGGTLASQRFVKPLPYHILTNRIKPLVAELPFRATWLQQFVGSNAAFLWRRRIGRNRNRTLAGAWLPGLQCAGCWLDELPELLLRGSEL